MSDPIYLDHNATTRLLPEALEVMLPYLREHFGNASSGHTFGRRVRAAVDAARAQVAELVGAAPEEVVFTSGGTESNNLAIRGVAARAPADRRAIVASDVEHPATLEACSALTGFETRRLPVDAACRIDLAEAGRQIQRDVLLVTLMQANNETGALQPIAEIARLAHAVGALLHVDGAQSVGKVRARMGELGADLLTIAGHKLGGPQGVGALVVRQGVALAPFARGAGHERGLRPGTENVAGIVGLGAACAIAGRSLEVEMARVGVLREALWGRLAQAVPGLRRTLPAGQACLPNTLHVRFPGCSGDDVLTSAEHVAASTGSACHAGHAEPSRVLLAMGVDGEDALGSVRLSLGRSTTETDVEQAAEALARGFRRTVALRAPAGSPPP